MNYDIHFDDAYTQPAFIAASAGSRPALRFTYRPALIAERSRLFAARRRLEPREFDRRAAEFAAERILSWDAIDDLGQPLTISAASLLECPDDAFARVPAIVLGSVCSDLDPAWPDATRGEHRRLAAQAASAGQTVGEVREERDEKNWSRG